MIFSAHVFLPLAKHCFVVSCRSNEANCNLEQKEEARKGHSSPLPGTVFLRRALKLNWSPAAFPDLKEWLEWGCGVPYSCSETGGQLPPVRLKMPQIFFSTAVAACLVMSKC